VAARKLIYFYKRIAKLGPAYLNCNERQSSCTRPAKKPRRGCPDCEYTIQRRYFLDELAKELALVTQSRESARKWPPEHLLRLVGEAAAADRAQPRGHGRRWNVVLATLVAVYRDEQGKAKAIDAYNLKQQVETARRGEKGRRDEEDWGD
jgi:hypothetical protein